FEAGEGREQVFVAADSPGGAGQCGDGVFGFAFGVESVEGDDVVRITLFPELAFGVEPGFLVCAIGEKRLVRPARGVGVGLGPLAGIRAVVQELGFESVTVLIVIAAGALDSVLVANAALGCASDFL